MSWTTSPQLKSVDGVPIGTQYGGGYVAGFISNTSNSVPTHALILAPAATGATGTGYTLATNLVWKTVATSTTGASSVFDGSINTAAIVTAGITDHPAAGFCTGLSIGGFTDWYLPSRLELDIAYFHLKPTSAANVTTAGTNSYSVPSRTSNFNESYPMQTGLMLFASGGSEAFQAANHWSSTEANATNTFRPGLSDGSQTSSNKTNTNRVRAFRRIAL